VIPNAAAKIPGACSYLPGSLRAMQQGRFAALPSVARQEGADAIGYLLWEKIATEAESQKKNPAQAALNVTAAALPEKAADAKIENDGTTDSSKSTEGGQTAATVCATFFEAMSTRKMSECSSGKVANINDEVGCSLGLLARDAVMDDREGAKSDAKRLALALAMRLVDAWPAYVTGLAATKVELAQIEVGRIVSTRTEKLTIEGLVTALSERLAALAGAPDVAKLAADLDKTKSRQLELTKAIAATTELLEGRKALKGKTSEIDTEIVKLEADLAQYKSDAQATANKLEAIFTLSKDPEKGVKELREFLEVVVKQLASAPDDPGFTDDVLGSIRAAAKTCDGKKDHVCTMIRDLVNETSKPEAVAFIGLLRAVSRRDYGLAVGIGIDATLRPVCTWLNPCTDANERKKRLRDAFKEEPSNDRYSGELAREFVSHVTVMLVDAKVGTQAVDSTDVVVGLADELMETSGDAAGIRRRIYEPKSVFVPTLAMRYGWIPGHYDAGGVSATHLFFSVEEVNLHGRLLYYENFYLGLHASFIDLLAPFAEMANRPKNFAGDAKYAVASALFTPRLDVVVAVPSLSRNLLVGAGVGLHMFRLAPKENGTFEYCFLNGSCVDGENGLANFGEVSLSVKLIY
jgi:hypothetical protein